MFKVIERDGEREKERKKEKTNCIRRKKEIEEKAYIKLNASLTKEDICILCNTCHNVNNPHIYQGILFLEFDSKIKLGDQLKILRTI